MNYVTALDLLAPSGAFEAPSVSTQEKSVRENVVRNMLWDGGLYCYEYTLGGYVLHNGHADYMRGAAMVGIMLGVREFAEPMLKGPLSMNAMLDINIDRNGFYTEVSPSYATHTRMLYTTIAELFEAARHIGWEDVESAYAHPAMSLFMTEPYNRQEVGGHMPHIGDAGPDRYAYDAARRNAEGKYTSADPYIKSQIESAWTLLVRSPSAEARQSAARLLRDSFGKDDLPTPPEDQWAVYHISRDMIADIAGQLPDPQRLEQDATFYGAKGLALLRGGTGAKRYGAQLAFGPIHNHGQKEALTWTFFARGAEWSFDPGYYNTHYRFGWTTPTVSHQAMVVNEKSYDWTSGSGNLVSWHNEPEVQWALATHPNAYRAEGVTRYERLIAQVHNPATGELGYWLDVGRVEGGETRDDSFHTALCKVDLNVDLPASTRPSLFGDKNLGQLLTDNGRLKGPEFEKKAFTGSPRATATGSSAPHARRPCPPWCMPSSARAHSRITNA